MSHRSPSRMEARRRHALTVAAGFDEFNLGELWEATRWLGYGYLSQQCLEWWREGLLERRMRDGTWVVGTRVARIPHERRGEFQYSGRAVYRWVD